MFVSDSAISRVPYRRPVEDSLYVRLLLLHSLTLSTGKWVTQNVQSPFWRFYWNQDSGAYITLTDGQVFGFSANALYLIPAGVRFSCGNDRAFRHFYIHFDVLGLLRLMMQALFAGPVGLPENALLQHQVALLAQRTEGEDPFPLATQCAAKSLLYAAFALYLATLPVSAYEKVEALSRDAEIVQPALAYIEDSLHGTLRISELASRCYLSVDHFARQFRRIVGQTPGDYIRERRVFRAAQLLLLSGDNLETIAERCGFGNRHYLTRVFTKIIGISPVAYRRLGKTR